MQVALSIKNLQKTYANQLHALKGIDLQVEQGDFFALLGSNGAGKTTAIGIICGLLHKTHGSVKILGLDQDTHENEVKSLIGLMPQEFNFNFFEPVEEILINQAGFHGIKKSTAKVRSEILLKKMEPWDKRLDMAKSLSGGMKRRLMLARALIHQPKILILDEPTAGVDVQLRQNLWNNVKELNKQGVTIILTTHLMHEAEEMCNKIAIINKGNLIKLDTTENLLNSIKTKKIIFKVKKINKINQKDLDGTFDIIGKFIKK